jgi:hypothetical protein
MKLPPYGQREEYFLMSKTTRIERSVQIAKHLLDPNPWNPNKTKPREQAAIAESLATYSQILDIIVRPNPDSPGRFQIIDGEHRFNELSEMVYATVLHGLADTDAKKLTIILNETRGSADKVELAQLLASLSEELGRDELAIALPYDGNELDELISLADVDWNQFEQDSQAKAEPDNGEEEEDDEEEKGDFIQIICVIPKDAFAIVQQAKQLISKERSLNDNDQIAWGQTMESLAADYLSGAIVDGEEE